MSVVNILVSRYSFVNLDVYKIRYYIIPATQEPRQDMTKLMTVPRKVAVFETSYHQYEIGSERLSLKNKKKFARTLISLLSEERKNNYAPGEFHGLVSRARNVALPNIQAGDRLQEVAREVLEEWGKKNRVKVKIYWKRVVIGKIIICPHSAKNEYMNYMIAEIDWPKLQKTD